ncbi:hypothetical protein [Brevundimonas subvibrioides]|uniref:Uncharacterized protein n=1 Tax=Brevundimonas subvibrioides (strain ATCC 15264 / DSM 4735 / LMG 14903 / NBRC 16000 / CB 81) TaxID=633149 RepID=D9QI75_BRESC|nr:hypothetical protein [Brevundimonas subvibrioides]ADK99377.1 hypothetical protein Bresu_0063 [Brevundimonas subvibrioides ATCC 15264]
MLDPREYAAFWGACGGLLSGAVGLVTAYSAKAGNPIAQRRAWLGLALGIVAGPIAAEALTEGIVLKIIPALDMRGVALTVGWMVANDPRALFDMLTRVVRAVFNLEPSS